MNKPIEIGRRIGFDFGEKRIGVATSDSESILVAPYKTIINDGELLLNLTNLLNEVNPVYVVVGDPKHLSGNESAKSIAALEFAKQIRQIFTGPIYFVDERLTTQNANSKMREMGKNEKQSKAMIDQIAAVSILESALLNEKSGTGVGRLF
ncbi:putative holliday junction resolvase [Candidatus Nanopelagicus hibericus]|uniref:Putative pre-16S rRNA nuclease n=1 Tax=Candidatus Nanopelagicus hibericus TaxID=1884915 RepID=A0A249K937_9ACTN|nr:Holliday junction resolvase RuvX [Candidatus Nanopelagicus hibericus]ASY13294.1 putative holliday junction resolvase [Candidatus Nanopelagicus hibericus]